MERVEIHQREQRYAGYLEVESVKVSYTLADGSMGPVVDREVLVRPDAAVVLAKDSGSGKYALVRQFRYAHRRNGSSGWMLEAIAGVMAQNESPEETARRESREEVGLEITSLRKCGLMYASPGTSTERYHLFLAEGVLSQDPHASDDDLEDIQVVWLSVSALQALVQEGQLDDVKTVAIVQRLLLEQLTDPDARP